MNWYASGGGIMQAGPFPSETAAREAFRLTEDARERQRRERGAASPHPWDCIAWPGPVEGGPEQLGTDPPKETR